MANSYFQFKQFTIHQDRCAMKVTTDGCLFGAWVAEAINNSELIINHCLDIGTGTGLLSLMIVQKNNVVIDSIEIDKDAADQATENSAASLFSTRIRVRHTDANDFEFNEKYDVIVSNPPFYEKELKGNNGQKNLAHHNEGLRLNDLLNIIKNNLNPEGFFYLLLPFKRNNEIKKLLKENEFDIERLTFVRQSVNHDFFRIMLAGKFNTDKQNETIIDEISIKDAEGRYTPAFISLLKDYYLHL